MRPYRLGMPHPVKILAIGDVTHDVKRFVVERPANYDFEPGQAAEVALDLDGWRDEKRPFTFTSLTSNPNLEFTIKRYPEHDGVTVRLHQLDIGDTLLLDDVWGAIKYTKPGVFIAGGAGVTPFIAILRDLEKTDSLAGSRLLFSNKTDDDIILGDSFTRMLGDDAVFTVTRQKDSRHLTDRIDKTFLERHVEDFSQAFYVCGPPRMVEDVTDALKQLGADAESVVIEE